MSNYSDDYTIADFQVGERVETHPGTDRWMRGDRFGTVTMIGRSLVHVQMDRSGRKIAFEPWLLGHVV